jgi:hypothetical protein
MISANLFKSFKANPSTTPKLPSSTKALKTEILELAQKTERGLKETPEERARMEALFGSLEKQGIKDSLKSPFVNAVWKLEYTTSDTVLGRGGQPRVGPTLQTIDAPNGFAKNAETVKYFGLIPVPVSVTAAIRPLTRSKVAVQFKRFTIGPVSFNAPEKAKGELDITYVDKDFRLSRGDKGSLFVLTKFSDL